MFFLSTDPLLDSQHDSEGSSETGRSMDGEEDVFPDLKLDGISPKPDKGNHDNGLYWFIEVITIMVYTGASREPMAIFRAIWLI